MKTFEIPKSDCNIFVGGVVTASTIDEMVADGAPEHAIVIWYKDKETVKAALQAVANAHWPDPQ